MNLDIDRSEIHDLLRNTTDPVIVDRCLLVLAYIDYPDASHAQISSMIDLPVRRVSEWSQILEKEGVRGLMKLGTRGYDWIAYSERPDELPESSAVPEGVADLVNARLLAVLDDLARINHEEWKERVNDVLMGISPEIDLARVSVRTSANLREGDHPDPPLVITDAAGGGSLEILEQGSFLHYWKAEYLEVIRSPKNAFRSDAYSLPIAHDYRSFSNGTYIGSIYLFRKVENGPFSLELRSLVQHLQNQIASFLLTRVLWKQSRSRMLQRFSEVLRRLPIESQLTAAEGRVAALLLAGEREQEIADTLSLSIRTVQNHKQRIYAKAGVSSLSELFSRVLSDSLFDR